MVYRLIKENYILLPKFSQRPDLPFKSNPPHVREPLSTTWAPTVNQFAFSVQIVKRSEYLSLQDQP